MDGDAGLDFQWLAGQARAKLHLQLQAPVHPFSLIPSGQEPDKTWTGVKLLTAMEMERDSVFCGKQNKGLTFSFFQKPFDVRVYRYQVDRPRIDRYQTNVVS